MKHLDSSHGNSLKLFRFSQMKEKNHELMYTTFFLLGIFALKVMLLYILGCCFYFVLTPFLVNS